MHILTKCSNKNVNIYEVFMLVEILEPWSSSLRDFLQQFEVRKINKRINITFINLPHIQQQQFFFIFICYISGLRMVAKYIFSSFLYMVGDLEPWAFWGFSLLGDFLQQFEVREISKTDK